MIFVFSFLFPQGLAIYWATGTMFMVAQQYHLLGWNGLVVPSWFPGANRVTALTIPRTPVKTGAGSGPGKKTVVVTSTKNARNGTKAGTNGTEASANGTEAGANGTKAGANGKAATGDEPAVRSQSATARSLARPNRPNRRRRRR
jgi:hypothetical protein